MKSNLNSSVSAVFYQTDFTPPPPRALGPRTAQSRISWFQNYDEEWLACIYEHSMEAGSRTPLSELGSPPRVWNLPAR